MYSGTTMTRYSGRLLGAHQKIDRAARKHLEHMAPKCQFPKTRHILAFEGGNGPDAIKRKSPAQDEPWHYMQPFNMQDTQLLQIIDSHYRHLVAALKQCDTVRASFEAAWLSHAMVDGLTPAHHFPYEEKLLELRGGKAISERTTVREKMFQPGSDIRSQMRNNWSYWGPKGLFTTHVGFEWGISVLIAPLRLAKKFPAHKAIDSFNAQPLEEWFRAVAQQVASLNLYDAFYEHGWTVPLARTVRRELAPTIVQSVSLVWYAAAKEAGVTKAV